MFTWLGYKFGEWLDRWEERNIVHTQQILLGDNCWLFSGFGLLIDVSLFSMLLFWIKVQVIAP